MTHAMQEGRKGLDGLESFPNPSITTGQPSMGARRSPPRPIRFHPEGAACRGEAAPHLYLLVACPHVIDGLGTAGRVMAQFGLAAAISHRRMAA
jgi:hypothetical protein